MARCFAGVKCELASVARSLGNQTGRTLDCNAAAAALPIRAQAPSLYRRKLGLQAEAPHLLSPSAGTASGHIVRTSVSVPRIGQSVKGRRQHSVRASAQASVQTAAKVGARETGSVPLEKLVEVVTNAAKTGAGVSIFEI